MFNLTYKEWLEGTSLFLHTRSSLLKALDAAILAFTKTKTPGNLVAVARAHEAWRNSHTPNSTSSRDIKSGVVTKLENSLTLVNEIRTEVPHFDWQNTTLRGVFSALLQSNAHDSALLQQALDLVPYHDAKLNRTVLQLIINARPGTCYIHVHTFQYNSTPPATQPSIIEDNNPRRRRLQYSSAKFTVEARIFSISPRTADHQIGFIQHCTLKSDVSSFTGGEQVQDAHSGGFPVGDSAGDNHAPWYYKDKSPHCTHPSWYKLAGRLPEKRWLEMSDSFINNVHPFHAISPGKYESHSLISSINRTQKFICYLVHRRPDHSERVLQSVAFTINVSLPVTHTMSGGGLKSFTTKIGNLQTNVSDISETTHPRSYKLPTVTGPRMNGLGEWRWRPFSTSNWRPVAW